MYAGDVRLVEVFVDHIPRVVSEHSAQVDLVLEVARDGDAVLVGCHLLLLRVGERDLVRFEQHQIRHLCARLDDAGLNHYVAVAVGVVEQHAFLVYIDEQNFVALFERTREHVILGDFLVDRIRFLFALTQLLADVAPRFLERRREIRALALALDLLELLHNVVARNPRALEYRRRLGARLLELAIGYCEAVGDLLLILGAILLEFAAHTLGLLPVLVHLEPARLESGNYVLELLVLGADQLLRAVDDFVGQSELRRDRERVRLAGCSDYQPIGRLQRVDVEFAGRVDKPVGLEREGFQFSVVRGRRAESSGGVYLLEYRYRERGALDRVGSRAQLVYEHERAVRYLTDNPDYIDHMRREGRQ